jgi:hypothetical protein
MQDARSAFFAANYSEDKGIQGFFDILVDHAQNMAVYPDAYQIVETFLKGVPSYIRDRMIKDGLSPEINTIDDFVAEAKKHETSKKTLDYYNKMNVARPEPTSRANPSYNDAAKPTRKRTGAAVVRKSTNQAKPVERRQRFLVPSGGANRTMNATRSPHKPAQPVRDKPSTGNANGNDKHHEHAPGEPTCYNCGRRGHMSRECKAPRKQREHVRAAHTEMPQDPHDADDESREEDHRSSPQGFEEDRPSLNENEEFVEVEVQSYAQGNSYYERETDTEFVAPMFDRLAEPEDMIATADIGKQDNGKVKMRKAVVRASKTARTRPIVRKEDKECLATFVSVGGFEAWTLWDSGSTTTGITPTFAQVADIPVFPLLDPHVLQLGTIGSRSVVNYGTNIEVITPGMKGTIYMDVANFDRYDMIIGTPYMRSNKVHLDFENDQVIVNGVATAATKVILADTDGRLRRYRSTDKRKE